MYNDPEVRESEIRNMSQIFTELKKEVLPELRRSRFVTEVEYENYSDAELQRLADRKLLYLVDEPAVLRIAATSEDPERKELFYGAAAERFGSQVGKYDLAILKLEQGSHAVTEMYLEQMKDQNDPDVLNARGVVELRRGNFDKAAEYFEKSGNDCAEKNLGIVALSKGDYTTASAKLKGAGDVNEAIANIMCGEFDAAADALKNDDSAIADYYRAVVAARKGKLKDAKKMLDSACEKDPSLREKALKDIVNYLTENKLI
jgi:tetratricopeptide (TPR) repeat protein